MGRAHLLIGLVAIMAMLCLLFSDEAELAMASSEHKAMLEFLLKRHINPKDAKVYVKAFEGEGYEHLNQLNALDEVTLASMKVKAGHIDLITMKVKAGQGSSSGCKIGRAHV